MGYGNRDSGTDLLKRVDDHPPRGYEKVFTSIMKLSGKTGQVFHAGLAKA